MWIACISPYYIYLCIIKQLWEATFSIFYIHIVPQMNNKNIYIAGPCVIESQELLNTVAAELVRLNEKYA